MKFLILCLLVYVGYRILKALMFPDQRSTELEEGGELARVDDVMVKDPYCETYFAKKSGVKEVINGQTHYFCSTDCRDKYLKLNQRV